MTLRVTDDFPLQGITIAVLVGYHVLNGVSRSARGPEETGGGIIAPREREIGGPVRRQTGEPGDRTA
ncbi:hypothetical protein [Spirillospora albida]|uniref:hypothetical protein n=1 Tax=Spirillospora albida TaxID=58123 RepID=UPI0004BFD9D2|nr:hypothetical protein [Spirillospora albida]